jgi:multidrug transporter EmrE-like cation transporter
MDKYAYIALTLALTVYGQLIMKARSLVLARGGGKLDYLVAMFTDLGVLSSFVAALAAAVAWSLAIEKAGLGLAYPFMALSFVLVPLGAAWFFGEALRPVQVLALGLIVAGVALNAWVTQG